jgi:ABC-type nitrate/sulfonate/bicarbonate transport system substrate-binding protein
MKKAILSALIVAVMMVIPLSSPLAAQDTEHTIWIGAGSTTLDPYYVPLFTLGRNILAEDGIGIEFVSLTTDEAVEAALTRGRVDAGILATVGLNRALNAGLSFKVVVGVERYNPFVLVTNADLTDLSELRGKKIAAQSRTSLSVTVAEVLLEEEAGLASGEDYEMVYVAGSGNRAAAMEAGTIDAAVVFGPVATNLVDRSEGRFKVYGGVWNVLEPMLWEGVAFSDSFRNGNPEVASAFVKAMLEAYAQFYEGDPAEMVKLVDDIPEVVDTDAAALQKEYELYQQIELYPLDGGINQDAYERMTEFLVDVGQLEDGQQVPYEDAIDPSFVEAAMAGTQ